MSITTYAELQSAIAAWSARSDLSARLPEFIALAEARMNRELRLRAQETSYSGTLSSGVLAVPTAWIEWKSFWVVDSGSYYYLEPLSLESLLVQYPLRSSDSRPGFFARDAGNFVFGPYPSSDYAVGGVYYAKLSSLEIAGTNWLLAQAPDAYLFASLVEVGAYLMDTERALVWETRYQQAVEALKRQERRQERSGGTLAIRSL